MSSDLAVAERHLLSRLRSRPALSGVRVVRAPTPEDFGAGVAYWPVGRPRQADTVGPGRIQTTTEFTVVYCFDGEDPGPGLAPAREIHAAIHDSAGEYALVGTVFGVLRVQPVMQSYRTGSGKRRWNIGGVYRVFSRGVEADEPPG